MSKIQLENYYLSRLWVICCSIYLTVCQDKFISKKLLNNSYTTFKTKHTKNTFELLHAMLCIKLECLSEQEGRHWYGYPGMLCESQAGICNVEAQHWQPRASWESLNQMWRLCPRMVLYGSETWWLTKGLKQKLQLLSNKRNWQPWRICNGELWRQTEQQPVGWAIRQRACHMLRTPDRYLDKRAIVWKPQGKHNRGRPRHTCRYTRIAESEKKFLTWWEVKSTVQKRVQVVGTNGWSTVHRLYVPTGMKTIGNEWTESVSKPC